MATQKNTSVTLGEQTDTDAVAQNAPGKDGSSPRDRLGLVVRPLTGAESQQLGVNKGVIVADVDGPAAQAGIEPGDVILAVNGRAVGSAEDLAKLVEQARGRVALLVQRGDTRLFVPIRVG